MRAGSWQFKPKLLIVVLYLAIGGGMLLLGRWQMHRAAEKIDLATESEQALLGDPVSVLELPVTTLGSKSEGKDSANRTAVKNNYTRVSLQGRARMEQQFLWDNRIRSGQAGYEVIVPVELEDGRLVLVNRGWVPVGSSRAVLPELSQNARGVSVLGILTYPSKGFARGEALSQNHNEWPRVIQYMDYNAMQHALQQPMIAGLVQGGSWVAKKQLASGRQESRVDGSKDSTDFFYPDNWKPVANGPAKHYGYAAQWFAMFIALTVLFVWLNLSKSMQGRAQ